jgi:divalent metal cation (Fe/Co/Zn/Cd) transporter
MEKGKSKTTVKIILSVVVGIISAFAAFMLLIIIFLATGLFGWSDGGEKKYLERLEKTTNITFWISVLAAICVGIYIMYKMNRPKKSNTVPSPGDTPLL